MRCALQSARVDEEQGVDPVKRRREDAMSGLGRQTIETNPVMDRLRNGQAAGGSWLSLCSPVAAESMAQIGWHWLAVNIEHVAWGLERRQLLPRYPAGRCRAGRPRALQ